MDESEIQQKIMIDAPAIGCSLMRNNCGALKGADGRVVRFGLANESPIRSKQIASSDLIGFTRVTIGPEHIGRTFAVFTAVEVKSPDWKPSNADNRYLAQNAFLQWVAKRGGFAFFANSVEGFRDNLRRFLA